MSEIGIPGLLEKFRIAELSRDRRVLKLDNLSHRTDELHHYEKFQHVRVEGSLEVEVTSEGVIATANVEEVIVKYSPEADPEMVKRVANSAYKVPINGAMDYRPGERITLYSYPGNQFPGFSFHCDLPKKK